MPAPGHNVRTVVGRYIDFHGRPMGGTVRFDPSTPIETADETITILPDPDGFVATLDETGSFTIDLPITNDPDISTSGFTYSVKENLTFAAPNEGKTYTRNSYNIQVPSVDPDEPLELGTVAPVPASGGITLIKGDKGDDGDDAYQVAVRNGFSGSESAWLASLHGADGTLPYNFTVSAVAPSSPALHDIWIDIS